MNIKIVECPNYAFDSKPIKIIRSSLIVTLDVCETCYNFLKSIYGSKQMKKIHKIEFNKESKTQCLSNYHNKLVDSFKS